MSYESPITVAFKNIRNQVNLVIENDIWKAVVNIGVAVDKDELMKALKYDREQYDRGYSDGFTDGFEAADKSIVRCKDCKHYLTDDIECPCNIGLADATPDAQYTWEPKPDWFCADGERREDK